MGDGRYRRGADSCGLGTVSDRKMRARTPPEPATDAAESNAMKPRPLEPRYRIGNPGTELGALAPHL
eukprot:3112191-Rhodomonas_salina.2